MRQIARGIYSINQVYSRKIGKTVRNSLESSLAALWSGLSQSQGNTSTAAKDADLRQAIEKLVSNEFELTDLGWFYHPTVLWNQVMGIQKFYDVSQAGWNSDSGPVRDGNFGQMDAQRGLRGMLYGIPAFESTNVVSSLQTYRNILAHPDAFGFATQTPGNEAVRIRAEDRLENLATLTVADIIYGVKELRDDAAVVLESNTSAVTS